MAIPRVTRSMTGAPPKMRTRSEQEEHDKAIEWRNKQLERMKPPPPGFRGGMAPMSPGIIPSPGIKPKKTPPLKKGKSKGRRKSVPTG